MMGKAVKLAEGNLDTHSKKVTMNRNSFKTWHARRDAAKKHLPPSDR